VDKWLIATHKSTAKQLREVMVLCHTAYEEDVTEKPANKQVSRQGIRNALEQRTVWLAVMKNRN